MKHTTYTLNVMSDSAMSRLVANKAIELTTHENSSSVDISIAADSFSINNAHEMDWLVTTFKISAVYSEITNEWSAFTGAGFNSRWHKNKHRAEAMAFLMMEQ